MVPIWPPSSNRLLIREAGRGQQQKHCDFGWALGLLASPQRRAACLDQRRPSSDVQMVEGQRSIGHAPPSATLNTAIPGYAKLECLVGRFRRSDKRGVETDLGGIRRIN